MTIHSQALEKFCQEKPQVIIQELLLLSPKEAALWLLAQSQNVISVLIGKLPSYYHRILLDELTIEGLKSLFEAIDLNQARFLLYALSPEKKLLLAKQLPRKIKTKLALKEVLIKGTLESVRFDSAASVYESATIEEVICSVQNGSLKPSPDIYICDEKNKLLSRVSLSKIILATTKKLPIINISPSRTPSLKIDQSIAAAIKNSDFIQQDTMPIVDEQNHLLGSVRFKILVDIFKASFTETSSINEIALDSVAGAFTHSLGALGSFFDSLTFEKQKNER
jgi:Mg/Co/Ni transporter MgtE